MSFDKVAYYLLYLLPILFLIWLFPLAFAGGEAEAIRTPLESLFDYVTNIITANVGDVSDPKTNATVDIIETGNEGAKKTLGLWLWLHEALIDVMLWFSSILGVGFDKGVALLLSFILGTIIIAVALWKFAKHFWKFAIVIAIAIAVVWILPIENLMLGN